MEKKMSKSEKILGTSKAISKHIWKKIKVYIKQAKSH